MVNLLGHLTLSPVCRAYGVRIVGLFYHFTRSFLTLTFENGPQVLCAVLMACVSTAQKHRLGRAKMPAEIRCTRFVRIVGLFYHFTGSLLTLKFGALVLCRCQALSLSLYIYIYPVLCRCAAPNCPNPKP
jgi:hypothetical protein